MKKTSIFTQIAIVVAIIVVVNLISNSLYYRLDFTADQRYTLSRATKDILADLPEVITVTAYVTEGLPPQLAYVKNDLQDQLIEYENLADGNLVFEFVNPNESEQLKQEAMQQGVAPVSINVVENDQRQQLQAFMGVVFKSGDRTEVIPMVQPGASLEYDLTTSVKKLAISDKPKIGFVQGYGEPDIQAMGQLVQQLSVLYEVEPFQITENTEVPSHYRSLVWISPADTISLGTQTMLDRYLEKGGRLFIAYSGVDGDLQNSMLNMAPDIGLTDWLGTYGLLYGPEYVVDVQNIPITVQQRSGFFTINSQRDFPYFLQVTNFADHPTTKGLETLLLPFVNPIYISNTDSSQTITPLLYSSEMSGVEPGPLGINIERQWRESDFSQPNQVLAASVSGIGMGGGKLIAVTNGEFLINGTGQQAQQLNPDNVNFGSNAVDWLSDDTGLIELRTKGVTNRPLDTVEDSTRELIKYGNVFAPILLILIYAGIRRTRLARKRQRWMQGNYN